MYGRGMPRPIAEVTSTAERRMANYWVAKDVRSRHAATHSRSNFNHRKKNGRLLGRGMPRPYNTFDSIAEVTSTAEERMAN